MKRENMKLISLLFVFVIVVGVFSFGVYADGDDETTQDTNILGNLTNTAGAINQGSSALDSLFNLFGTGINKLIGSNPIVHGLLGGAFSGFNTYKNLNKDIDFTVTKDKVNISEDERDYIDKDKFNSADYANYGDQLYEGRIQGVQREETTNNSRSINSSDGPYDTMVLTDKNVFDIEYIKTQPLSTLYEENTSPAFRLEKETTVQQLYNLDNNSVQGQKRGMLFEDPNKSIQNSYEYRYLVAKYKKAEYKGNINVSLKTSDLLDGEWLTFLLSPFSTGKNLLSLDKVSDNKKLNEEIRNARTVKDIYQIFHLQFNSWTNDENATLNYDQLDCFDESGLPIGTTGQETLPKVAFDWTFADKSNTSTAINGNQLDRVEWCDVNPNDKTKSGIYCDATQFSIEVLRKINEINKFVEQNKSQFICPQPGVNRPIITDVNNIGVSSLDSSYDGINKILVDYRVEGGFDVWAAPNQTIAQLEIKFNSTSKADPISNTVTLNIIADDIRIHGVFEGTEEFIVGYLPDSTDYEVTAKLINFVETIPNLKGDDELKNMFNTSAVECALDHTSQNIKLFSKKINPKFKDDVYVNFRSLLMYDGYSDDFRMDFDEYYRTQFMGVSNFYYNPTGNGDDLYKYFIHPDKFKFQIGFDEGKTLSGPGRYEVQVNIEYDDQWRLFDDAHNLVGDITIKLTKEIGPEMDSPVYYMPFDGVVGITTPNARQGYGLDYIGDVIDLDHEINMRSEPFTSSNTVNTLSVKEYGVRAEDFAIMNNNQTRGMILSINTDSAHRNPNLRFVPSRASPVVLKVGNQLNDAYAFYKLSIGNPENLGGVAAHPGQELTKWTGVGECNDFTGVPIQQMFLNKPDLLATNSQLAPHTPSQTYSYGVEWPEDIIIRKGNVFLRTIFYTPSNFTTGTGISQLYADSYSDDMMLYTYNGNQEISGKDIELKNVFGQSYDIKSLKQIYDLVAEKKACINYSATNLEVYYNPKAIIEKFFNNSMEYEEQNVWAESKGGCIKD